MKHLREDGRRLLTEPWKILTFKEQSERKSTKEFEKYLNRVSGENASAEV